MSVSFDFELMKHAELARQASPSCPVSDFFSMLINLIPRDTNLVQQNFSGSNTDGSFTTAVSNSISGPLGKIP